MKLYISPLSAILLFLFLYAILPAPTDMPLDVTPEDIELLSYNDTVIVGCFARNPNDKYWVGTVYYELWGNGKYLGMFGYPRVCINAGGRYYFNHKFHIRELGEHKQIKVKFVWYNQEVEKVFNLDK